MEFESLERAIAFYAGETPQKTCLIEAESGKEIAYYDFWNSILKFAKRLTDSGLRRGDLAMVRVTQSIETLIAAFGVHMAGGVYVPVAKKIGAQGALERLNYFKPRFYIAASPVEHSCEYLDIYSVNDDSGEPCSGAVNFPDPDAAGDIIFTTGTTGSPKGVMRSHRGYIEAAKEFSDEDGVKFTSDDVFLSCVSQHLIGGINLLRHPLINGGTYVLGGDAVFADEFLRTVKKYGVTVLSLLAAQLSILLRSEEEFKSCCSGVRLMYLRSSAVSVSDQAKLMALMPDTRMFIYYGATEALAICLHDLNKHGIVPMRLGKPTPNTEVRILDGEGEPMLNSAYDRPGVIACKSPALMKGYWGNPELTAEIYKDGWLRMGDIGYMDGEGFLYHMGRGDEVITSGGAKVAPSEIEDAALATGRIKECACVPVKDGVMGDVPKLFVVMNDGEEFSPSKIYDYISQRLEAYKLPRAIERLDALPRTEHNMKIDKRRLSEL